jgi:hypothetical protein
MGRKVEQTLEALRKAPPNDARVQEMLVKAAADAVWQYFVQLEVCDIHNHDRAIEAYGIPERVLAMVGSRFD